MQLTDNNCDAKKLNQIRERYGGIGCNCSLFITKGNGEPKHRLEGSIGVEVGIEWMMEHYHGLVEQAAFS